MKTTFFNSNVPNENVDPNLGGGLNYHLATGTKAQANKILSDMRKGFHISVYAEDDFTVSVLKMALNQKVKVLPQKVASRNVAVSEDEAEKWLEILMNRANLDISLTRIAKQLGHDKVGSGDEQTISIVTLDDIESIVRQSRTSCKKITKQGVYRAFVQGYAGDIPLKPWMKNTQIIKAMLSEKPRAEGIFNDSLDFEKTSNIIQEAFQTLSPYYGPADDVMFKLNHIRSANGENTSLRMIPLARKKLREGVRVNDFVLESEETITVKDHSYCNYLHRLVNRPLWLALIPTIKLTADCSGAYVNIGSNAEEDDPNHYSSVVKRIIGTRDGDIPTTYLEETCHDVHETMVVKALKHSVTNDSFAIVPETNPIVIKEVISEGLRTILNCESTGLITARAPLFAGQTLTLSDEAIENFIYISLSDSNTHKRLLTSRDGFATVAVSLAIRLQAELAVMGIHIPDTLADGFSNTILEKLQKSPAAYASSVSVWDDMPIQCL